MNNKCPIEEPMCASQVRTAVKVPLVLSNGETVPSEIVSFTGLSDGKEHFAVKLGNPDINSPLIRLHSECLTGDVFGSARCDCGPQLNEAMDRIVEEGRGVVVYLRGHEGRGIGLVAKLQAYQLQDGGRDTVDANLDLGLPADARHYGAATQILKDLGVTTVRLMTNNPDKVTSLVEYGVPVAERVALTPRPNDHNLAYLRTKRDRMGHDLPGLAEPPVADEAPVVDQRAQRADGSPVVEQRAERAISRDHIEETHA